MVFDKVLQHVNAYFQQALESGQDLEEIMQSFRYNPLPTELTKDTDASDKELRRVGQILSTQYMLDMHNIKSRATTLPGQEEQ
jgi:hypothetical protein